MYLAKMRGHYYKYESIRRNGKVCKKYYGRANAFEVMLYKISKFLKEIEQNGKSN
jgi:hypothetical protein